MIFHLPLAPQLTARTRFSPPPPLSNQCVSVGEAIELLDNAIAKGNIDMAAIAGPGDPLATPNITVEAARRIHEKYPDLPIGLLTAGIGCANIAGDLAKVGVRHVELKVEAVRTGIIEKIFAWIRPGSKTLKLSEVAKLLIKEQSSAVSALKFHGITVSILTTLYPGYNIDHIGKISSEMLELGADSISLVPYTPLVGAEVDLEATTIDQTEEARLKAGRSLPVVSPVIHDSLQTAQTGSLLESGNLPKPTQSRPNVAVVSSNGIEVDLHLGHAIRFLIYGQREDGLICLLESRDAPEPGTGSQRWLQVADLLSDCFLLLAGSVGEKPRKILSSEGLRVYISEDNIEGIVDTLYGGGKKKKS